MSRIANKLDRIREHRSQILCVLADVRGQGSPFNISVWSPGKQRVVKLSYNTRDGRRLVQNLTPEAKHWCALSAPRWLIISEGLFGHADETISGFCRQHMPDDRTMAKKDDDHERAIAQYVVNCQNRYVALPGQTLGPSRRGTASESWRNA